MARNRDMEKAACAIRADHFIAAGLNPTEEEFLNAVKDEIAARKNKLYVDVLFSPNWPLATQDFMVQYLRPQYQRIRDSIEEVSKGNKTSEPPHIVHVPCGEAPISNVSVCNLDQPPLLQDERIKLQPESADSSQILTNPVLADSQEAHVYPTSKESTENSRVSTPSIEKSRQGVKQLTQAKLPPTQLQSKEPTTLLKSNDIIQSPSSASMPVVSVQNNTTTVWPLALIPTPPIQPEPPSSPPTPIEPPIDLPQPINLNTSRWDYVLSKVSQHPLIAAITGGIATLSAIGALGCAIRSCLGRVRRNTGSFFSGGRGHGGGGPGGGPGGGGGSGGNGGHGGHGDSGSDGGEWLTGRPANRLHDPEILVVPSSLFVAGPAAGSSSIFGWLPSFRRSSSKKKQVEARYIVKLREVLATPDGTPNGRQYERVTLRVPTPSAQPADIAPNAFLDEAAAAVVHAGSVTPPPRRVTRPSPLASTAHSQTPTTSTSGPGSPRTPAALVTHGHSTTLIPPPDLAVVSPEQGVLSQTAPALLTAAAPVGVPADSPIPSALPGLVHGLGLLAESSTDIAPAATTAPSGEPAHSSALVALGISTALSEELPAPDEGTVVEGLAAPSDSIVDLERAPTGIAPDADKPS